MNSVNDTSGPCPAGQAEAPRVSVIVPTYNREATIVRALDSVFAQTFGDYEILVCDDASTDKTCEIVRSYMEKDARIKLDILPENQGAGVARNLGMAAAKGDYIAFLDSDDEWLPEKLDRQVALMDSRDEQVGVCFSGADTIRDDDFDHPVEYRPSLSWEKDSYRKFVMDRIPFITSGIMFRRSLLEVAGLMVPEMRRNQDAEFLLRLFQHSSLAVLPDCFARFNVDTSPSKGTFDRMVQAFPFHQAHVPQIRKDLGWWAATYYHAGLRMNLCGVAIREQRWLPGCCQFIRRLGVFPVLFPSDLLRLVKAFARVVVGDRRVKAK